MSNLNHTGQVERRKSVIDVFEHVHGGVQKYEPCSVLHGGPVGELGLVVHLRAMRVTVRRAAEALSDSLDHEHPTSGRCPACRSRRVLVTAEHMGTSTCFCAECERIWDRVPQSHSNE
jgi:hypothetical protein